MKRTSLFKQYLLAEEILTTPVAHDPFCATVGCGGDANSAALLAAPDVELLTLTEMADAVWRIADAVDLPVFAYARLMAGSRRAPLPAVNSIRRWTRLRVPAALRISKWYRRLCRFPGSEIERELAEPV